MDFISLWYFPEQDFEAWQELVVYPEVETYQDYLSALAAVQAAVERMGQTARRIEIRVAEMQEALETLGLPNTPEGRAAVISMYGRGI